VREDRAQPQRREKFVIDAAGELVRVRPPVVGIDRDGRRIDARDDRVAVCSPT
jgi:hypothetical protein